MIVINSSTRQFNIPGADMTFGVEADAGSERKHFQCPRYVGNNLDLMGCFVRLNYRNANGDVDSYLVEDMTVDGDNVLFSWELSPKVTAYKGQIRFVLCVVGPDTKVAWHTTLGTGVVLEGLEPEAAVIQNGTVDVVASLINMVNQQTAVVEAEGATQIKAVQTAAQTAQVASVAEIEAKGVNVRASIPDDYTALSGAVRAIEKGMAPGIVCEVEGTAVAVSDASNQAMQGLRIFGRSTQNGVPTPDAPVEIKSVVEPVVTVAGKNLLKVTATSRTGNGVTATINADGSIVCNGTATDTVGIVVSNKLQSSCLNNGSTYRLTGCPTGGSKNSYLLQVNGVWAADYGEGVTFVHQSNVVSVIINIMAGTVCNNLTFYPMITLPNMDAEWEPYSGQTVELTHTLSGIPVTSGGNYTDSDGQQWISDEVDLERGVYVQRIRVVDIASHGIGVTGLNNGGNGLIISTPYKVKKGGYGLICTHAPFDPIRTFAEGTIYENEGNAVICGNSADTFDTLKEAYGSATLHYVLATPIETPLTETEIAAYSAMHTNYPNTTVLNDAGAHMVVKYAADTKLYIDNKIKEAFA